MAKIPLRVYLKDIEDLIDRGEIEQAIAHAKSILRTFPKHLETYRLLGKAFLESQRYAEAADILQRVLSVTPDDFISQIGMSIIREDEGNLDAAIWHMERAYEVQPFNPAVQDELRRLYGRRDGVEPPKIRLTRGALVRMYARGELYPQAIAETRAALAEDPQRLDLRVLLARLYYLSGQKNDAAEVCSELISKLPYCYEANRLLAEILPTTSRASETPKFQQRIFSLDPYEAFISPSAPTSQQVPDQAVMVEQFSLEQGAEASPAPDWTRTVGVAWEEHSEEALPDWLSTLTTEASSAEEQPPSEAPAAPVGDEEELMPEWMKEAGWTPSDRSADEIMADQQVSFEVEAGEEPNGEEEAVQAAEIPDWLQSIAPSEEVLSPEAEQDRSEWLEDILSETGTSAEEKAGLEAGETVASELSELEPTVDEEAPLPEWIAGFGSVIEPASEEAEITGLEIGASETEDALPDWLSELEIGEEAVISPAGEEGPSVIDEMDIAIQESEASAEVLPTSEDAFSAGEQTAGWLEEFQTGSASQSDVETQNLASPSEYASLSDFESPQDETQPPEWLSDITSSAGEEIPAAVSEEPVSEEAPAPQPAAETPDTSDTDAMMAWLESLAARQGADEATLITSPEERTDTPPDWVLKEMESVGSEDITQPVSTARAQPASGI